MFLVRLLFVMLLSVSMISLAQASGRPKVPTIADTEARNETATPSFSGQRHDAQRVASFLVDALLLSNAQQHAVAAYTLAEQQALALALTAADAAQAQHEYQLAMHRVLAASQWQTYGALRQQFAGTLLPLDGPGLALR
jgi:hypothetical protein